MSTLDPIGDFYLPGPAAQESDHEPAPRMAARESPAETASVDDDAAESRRGGRGSVLLAMLLMSGLAVGGWYLLQPDTLPIRRVNIEGEFRELSQTELQTLVVENLQGGFFSVDVGNLREVLQDNPWVREVWIQRSWPDALDIAVREEVAAARWNDNGLVNGNGDYFEPPLADLPAGLPQLEGPDGMQSQLTEQLLNLQTLLAPLGLHIKKLALSERRAWSFVTDSGLRVVLGREQFDDRLRRFIELVPASLGDRLAEAAYIDMRYTNGFAVRFNEEKGAPEKGANEGNGAA